MLQIVPLDRHRAGHRRRFIRYPHAIYRGDPNWVPPLEMAQHVLLSNKEPFYEHAETQLFMARRDGRDVGRIAATENRKHNEIHNDRVGFAGFFECVRDPEVSRALFAAAEDWLRARGLDTMRGPVNLSTNHTIGLFVSGEPGPPMIDMTYNPPYYEDLFLEAGFSKVMDVTAHKMSVARPETMDRLEKICQRVEDKEDVTSRIIDMKHFDRDLQIIKQIYNAAWDQNWGFVPLSDKEIDHIAEDLKMVVDPGLVRYIFVGERPAGFIAVVRNLNEILVKMNGRLFPFGLFRILFGMSKIKSVRLLLMGVTREFRNRGLETVLYYRAMQYSISRGYTLCENSWLLETNDQVLRASEFMGGREYRRYRIYDRKIT